MFLRYFHHGQHIAAADLFTRGGHLGEAGGVGKDQVIREDHSEGFFPDEPFGAPDRMAETEGFLLADIGDGACVGHAFRYFPEDIIPVTFT